MSNAIISTVYGEEMKDVHVVRRSVASQRSRCTCLGFILDFLLGGGEEIHPLTIQGAMGAIPHRNQKLSGVCGEQLHIQLQVTRRQKLYLALHL